MFPKHLGKLILQRLRLKIQGVVQGVGFRPFVYVLANECELRGFVRNDSGGVFIEIEGEKKNLHDFLSLLREQSPPLSHITKIKIEKIKVQGDKGFEILQSKRLAVENTLVSPDASICDECLKELFDEDDKRFRHPFINCTNCGPRFTITKDIPYDRPNTTMSVFKMCQSCESEYNNQLDRRFHAQPNACRDCGARVWFVGKKEKEIFDEDAILASQKVLSENGIVAVKGIGGFHLACDALCDAALRILRKRKDRVDKPFAIMCRDLARAESFVEIGDAERVLLMSKERPIVLLRKKRDAKISELVAPNNLFLGMMLPYSPLHHLLLNSIDKKFRSLDVLVMTSGNFSNEPIVKDNAEALEKLSALADAFLLHDRDIFVPCDDSALPQMRKRNTIRLFNGNVAARQRNVSQMRGSFKAKIISQQNFAAPNRAVIAVARSVKCKTDNLFIRAQVVFRHHRSNVRVMMLNCDEFGFRLKDSLQIILCPTRR
jgi:hydrogenase maturation protein HypF